MDVTNLRNSVAVKNMGGVRDNSSVPMRRAVKAHRRRAEIDKEQLKRSLDKVIKNTRFQYDIKDKIGYFIVKIIDKDTDKIIREIPSRALQKMHDDIEQALGLLFDELA